MKQKIIFNTSLIIIGIILGLFLFSVYQFQQRINRIETAVIQADQKITNIENFINTKLIQKPGENKKQ